MRSTDGEESADMQKGPCWGGGGRYMNDNIRDKEI